MRAWLTRNGWDLPREHFNIEFIVGVAKFLQVVGSWGNHAGPTWGQRCVWYQGPSHSEGKTTSKWTSAFPLQHNASFDRALQCNFWQWPNITLLHTHTHAHRWCCKYGTGNDDPKGWSQKSQKKNQRLWLLLCCSWKNTMSLQQYTSTIFYNHEHMSFSHGCFNKKFVFERILRTCSKGALRFLSASWTAQGQHPWLWSPFLKESGTLS